MAINAEDQIMRTVQISEADAELLKKVKAKNFAKYQKRVRAEQKKFRNNPAKLAKAIRKLIERDNHANENPESYDNGTMHWYQLNWATIRGRELNKFKKIDMSIAVIPEQNENLRETAETWLDPDGWNNGNGMLVEIPVECGSTGCIAGWSTTLAGYPMVSLLRGVRDLDQASEVYSNNATIQAENCRVGSELRQIPEVANNLLALRTEDQKEWLFSANRTMPEVIWGLKKIENGNYEWDGDTYIQEKYYRTTEATASSLSEPPVRGCTCPLCRF